MAGNWKTERRLIETEAAGKDELENKDKLSEVERDIEMLRNGLKMVENIIKEGNDEVQAQLLKTVLIRDVLTKASMKVSTGLTT